MRGIYGKIKVVCMKLRVEYIKRPYKKKVYSYPFLVSSYRDENGKPQRKIHQKLTHLPEVAVQALDRALREGIKSEYIDINSIIFEEAIDFGDAWSAFRLSEDIGIIEQLKLLPEKYRLPIQAMIIDRVINPEPFSRRALASEFPDSGLSRILKADKSPSLDIWYQSLESLVDHQMEIQKKLYRGCSNRIFLYDITSTYFEGKCCPLAAFGYNRDGKNGKLQIVVGLLCNGEGRPLAVRVFKGNTKDETTVLGQIEELKDDFGVTEMVFVGDRGMIASKRLEDLEADGYGWLKTITALKRSDMMALVEDEEHPIRLGLFDVMNLREVVDGCYVIITDIPEESMDKEEVLRRYKSLYEVEKAFRTMKTSNLMMRPIRHWNPKRVEGHVFMCMLAYLIVWESRNRLRNLLERDTETRECEGDSLREIWKALNKIKLGIIDCDGRKVTEISALTTRQKRILKALNAQIMTKERIRLGLRRHKKRN